jgi:large subunit ribosomal protein L14e
VEVGRVAVVNYGPDSGKHVIIVDIVDQSRALVDGPTSGVSRQVLAFRRMHLTDLVVPLARTAGTKSVLKAAQKFDLDSKWKLTPWAKKQQLRSKRQNATDFDRFKVMLAKKQRRVIVYREVKKLKKTQ